MSRCTINAEHCEHCGSTDPEDTDRFANEGYSVCCNELLTDRAGCRDHHGEFQRTQDAIDRFVAAAGFTGQYAREAYINQHGIEKFDAECQRVWATVR